MAGKTLAQQGVTKEIIPPYYSVKEVVLPFNKFPGVDPLLGPEMRSTGEVMGVGRTFAEAFAKAQLGSNSTMKKQGRALLSVREGDKERVVDLAAKLLKFGFELDATHGTAIVLGEAGINPRLVNKVHEGRPHIQDRSK
ncbi:carbamoyl phosphate synthase large subunit, partial [Pseudomonas aeruginosa]|nr:carbamoyl phosphate synthase large subunit [Pseudomonas aeruginosa]